MIGDQGATDPNKPTGGLAGDTPDVPGSVPPAGSGPSVPPEPKPGEPSVPPVGPTPPAGGPTPSPTPTVEPEVPGGAPPGPTPLGGDTQKPEV